VGEALPAADVKLTDPVFGDTGTIELPGRPEQNIPEAGCSPADLEMHYSPALDDPERTEREHIKSREYAWRYAWEADNRYHYSESYPDIGKDVLAYYVPQGKYFRVDFAPCGLEDRPGDATPNPDVPYSPPFTLPATPGRRVPTPGNQDKRREDKKKEQEDEKRKKQKLR
jgi:hypothetical protein